MTSMFGILVLLPLLSASSSAPSPAPSFAAQGDASKAPLLDERALHLAMTRLATEHPDLVTVLQLGPIPVESRQKRKIEALRVAAGSPDPARPRPAMLVVANIDGPLVWTSGVALDHARRLAEGYATDAKVKELLDSTTIYIVPRVDMDAAEARFKSPLFEQRASGPGIDNDRDGRIGEDGPADVDGDGQITSIRVVDPEGEWMADPTDPRVLIKADPKKGQRGTWKLWPEGRDADKDGKIAEDPELDVVLNRNFPQGWQEHAPEAGVFATDEPGARGLCDFVLAHKDIALVVTYGTLDDVVDKPKSEGKEPRRSANPSEGVPESDVAILDEIGRRYREITKSKSKGDGKDAGTFQAWIQAQRGLWAIDIAPWSVPIDEPAAKAGEKPGEKAGEKAGEKSAEKTAEKKEGREAVKDASKDAAKDAGKDATDAAKDKDKNEVKPSDDAKRMRWIDAHNEPARFVPWHAFQHPDLGPVEIGGFAPYALVEPPEAERVEIAAKHFEFLVALGSTLARVKIVDAKAKDLGSGLWEVKAVLENDALLPYASAFARRANTVRPARVDLKLPGDAQLLGGHVQELVRDLGGSGARHEMRWLVRGAPPSALHIVVDTDHAGVVNVVPEVK